MQHYTVMRRKRTIVLLTAAGLAACLVLFWSRRTPEPSYNGRTLSQWLDNLWYSDNAQDRAAQEAVKAMGTNVLPHLRPMFNAHDSAFKRSVMPRLAKQSLVKIRYLRDYEHQERASRACRALGPLAVEYVPEWTSMLDDTSRLTGPWCGLVAIVDVQPRSNSIPQFTKALTNAFGQMRELAARELGNHPTLARSAVPLLVRCTKDLDPRVREASIRSLARFTADAPIVVPALVEALDAQDAATRNVAATSLALMGPSARSATARLIECLKDPDSGVRAMAQWALTQIGKDSQ